MRVWACGLLAAMGFSCLAMAHGQARAGATGNYVDAIDYPSPEGGWDRFFDLEASLAGGFDSVCGDTFCEGDYSNLRPLSYRCSVERTSGIIGECVWTFAGSYQDIDPDNGKVKVDARLWQCRTPINPGTHIEQLYSALEPIGPHDVLHKLLPGGNKSIYDGLTECL
ncbi:hypothetical protein [Dyella sp.]|uniref:hypothetical protein n=1 Tax=Dyella sp. TaxID=1869338 RepID=UPI002ED1C5B8